MRFELDEANKRIKQLEEQVSQKNEQLAEYREQIRDFVAHQKELTKQLEKNEVPYEFRADGVIKLVQ